ncbi:MAG TPA: metallophosphoesterase [Herpetosiphonaceae bacterium]
MAHTLSTSDPEARQAPPARRSRPFPLRRVLTTVLSWMSVCWLVIAVVLSPAVPGGWLTMLGLALLSAAPLLGMARWFGGGGVPSALARLLVIRPFWYTQLALPLLAIAGLLGTLVGLVFGAPGAGGRTALLAVGLVYAGGVLAGWIGSRRLTVRRLEARLANLPAELDGLRIAQISDLHVGPHTSRRHLARISATVAASQPDLIAITGDQVDDYADDVRHFAAAFGDLAAPLGVFAIAGNHDVYAGWDGVRAGLERMGVRVLVNEAERLSHRGAGFWLAGTGDPAGGYAGGGGSPVAPDIERTLARVPAGDFTITLAHNPALWPALAERGVDLTLSGHTHYGQLGIPRLGWSLASAFLEHAMGWYRRDGSLLYINPGTNFWGIPFRLGANPEVTVLTLRHAAEPDQGIGPERA